MRIYLVGAIILRQMIVVFKCKRSFQSHFRKQYHTFSQVIQSDCRSGSCVTVTTRLQLQFYKIYKGSGNKIKNSKFLIVKYKRQKLIKHQLFTADVDIKVFMIRVILNCAHASLFALQVSRPVFRGKSHIKVTGMFFVSLTGINCGFWCHFQTFWSGSRQKVSISIYP